MSEWKKCPKCGQHSFVYDDYFGRHRCNFEGCYYMEKIGEKVKYKKIRSANRLYEIIKAGNGAFFSKCGLPQVDVHYLETLDISQDAFINTMEDLEKGKLFEEKK